MMSNKSSKKSHPLYNLIYSATDNYLTVEDEELNKQICSEILRNPESPKIASKVINKVINKSLTGHRYQSIWYSLLLLDSAIKSTDSRFCAAILTKEFLGDFVKIIDPKYLVPEFVQEKFIYIMKEWVSSLSNVSGYQNLVKYYKMVEYPRQVPQPYPNDSAKHTQRLYPTDIVCVASSKPIFGTQGVQVKDKIIHDIDIIETNLTVFSDTLRTVNPETVTNEELKFLEELYETGEKMQMRINEILPSISWEDVINQLIQVNDKILTTADKYRRLLKTKSQLTLSISNKTPAKTTYMTEIYDETNFVNDRKNFVLPEIYAPGSLPSYNEAVSIQAEKRTLEQEFNLMSFDDEELSKSYKNLPLPSIPQEHNDNSSHLINNDIPNTSNNGGLSSNEFDEFIELIAKRQQKPTEAMDEIYAPPLYDESALKHDKP